MSAAVSRAARLGDMPAVLMLVWAGWLVVPLSFSGLAQARAAIAAGHETPPSTETSTRVATADHRAEVAVVDRRSDVSVAGHRVEGAPEGAGRAARTSTTPPRLGWGWAGFARGGSGVDTWPKHQPAAYSGGSAFPALTNTPATPPLTDAPASSLTHITPAHPLSDIPAAPPLTDASASSLSDIPAAPRLSNSPATNAPANGPTAGLSGGQAWGALSGAGLREVEAAALAEELARERARIAGEVHDAAGHGFSTIAMQAGLALLVLEESPEQARESLRAIRETSLEALAQLRAALDLIDPGQAVPRHEDLPALIDGVRAAGLPVDVEPAEPAVPSHLRGTVYRVVRESLTNVIRHAGPTRALVRVANDPCEFVLEVADRGSGAGGAGEGRGLAGMRERVRAAGGQFSAGPRDGGGFQVVARFPRETA
ncbi:histidine kinase [Nonomuraea africana]|uniref:histidine kinase n=1 Tax=Nonomuraea africana TaxID=46171 RepID=A0ABR9KIJ2_9ACTN|nr:histidine kinase [Nonomuraea africana]MBE1561775.1 signal transduction histidine kinase [Nonomuraea africana]